MKDLTPEAGIDKEANAEGRKYTLNDSIHAPEQLTFINGYKAGRLKSLSESKEKDEQLKKTNLLLAEVAGKKIKLENDLESKDQRIKELESKIEALKYGENL